MVSNLSAAQKLKRCCRTSTSSGYSSHSPPLSATSYSCCHPQQGTTHQQGPVGIPAITLVRDQAPGLAVIHEGETIPRPIWPSLGNDSKQHHNEGCVERNADIKGIQLIIRVGLFFINLIFFLLWGNKG